MPTVHVEHRPEGPRLTGRDYRLSFTAERPYAALEDAEGNPWAELFLGASVHALHGLDESARLEPPELEALPDGVTRVVVRASSSLWAARRLEILCRPDRLEVSAVASGEGRPTDVHLLGGYYSGHLRWGSGFFQSGARFSSVFNPEPSGPERRATPAGEAQAIDVLGTSLPGKGHWFFTPPPFAYGLSRSPVEASRPVPAPALGADQGGTPESLATGGTPSANAGEIPAGPWATVALAAPPGEHNFTAFHYDASGDAFSFRLAYEGQTAFRGEFRTPTLVIVLGDPDPYAGLERAVRIVRQNWLGPAPEPRRAAWWSEPILCGWGAQCSLANRAGGRAPDYSRQEHYDAFLAELAAHGLEPGTVVLDDKWSLTYGNSEPDPAKWPDLKGWIARQHARGRRVLLWWKAWDPEGLPAGECVTNAAGLPVAADPSNPAYEQRLRASVRAMLSADGLDADGFKVDFSARTPSGPGLRRLGSPWGVELLHRLLWILRDEAKRAKPDGLVMAHAPNPLFADAADMVRLNDVNTGAPVLAQMEHRARVSRAAVPELLVDTDNWPMPSRAAWREYVAAQPRIGIPSLYFVTHLDGGEPLEPEDYALVARAWAEWRGRPEARTEGSS